LKSPSESVETSPPSVITPNALAKQLGCSPRRIRQLARDIGACRLFGKTMVLLPEDVQAILEAAKPEPKQPRATQVPLLNTDYEDLVRLRERQKREELRKRRQRRKLSPPE
jgi:hypothetical protein